MDRIRKFIFYKSYFKDFFESQSERVQDKIDHILFLISVAEWIPSKFFRNIKGNDGLYEIRIEFEGNIYRVFCCFDKGYLIILFNGFTKKSKKTPKKEIIKALRLKDEYFREKLRSGRNAK